MSSRLTALFIKRFRTTDGGTDFRLIQWKVGAFNSRSYITKNGEETVLLFARKHFSRHFCPFLSHFLHIHIMCTPKSYENNERFACSSVSHLFVEIWCNKQAYWTKSYEYALNIIIIFYSLDRVFHFIHIAMAKSVVIILVCQNNRNFQWICSDDDDDDDEWTKLG